MMKEGCVPLTDFDNMTNQRIKHIIQMQEKRLKEQQDYIESQRKQQEKQMKKNKL